MGRGKERNMRNRKQCLLSQQIYFNEQVVTKFKMKKKADSSQNTQLKYESPAGKKAIRV